MYLFWLRGGNAPPTHLPGSLTKTGILDSTLRQSTFGKQVSGYLIARNLFGDAVTVVPPLSFSA